MSKWKEIGLGDTATFYNGYPFKPTEWSSSGKEIIRIQNLTKGSSQTNYFEGKLSNKYSVTKGDILISWSGSLGVYEWGKEDAWLNQHLFKVVFDKEEIDKSFFKYLISISLEKLETQVHGATMKHITKKNFDAFPVNLPPLPTQQKIASILDAADTLRQKDKALLAKYDELTQALFLDMFGDPVSNPKGWEIYNFGKVVLNKDSKRVPIKSADRDLINGIYPYYGASGIIDYVDDFVFEEENLLIGEDGANLITRNSPIAFIASGNYWVNNHAHVLGFNGVALLIYLKYFINSINLEPYITGSAQPKLNRGNMDKIKVSIPPLLLQNQFAERVAVIEQQKAIAQASLDKSEELFNSLLHKAFKGELV